VLTCYEKAAFEAYAEVADRYRKGMPERAVFFKTCDMMVLEADRRASAEKVKAAEAALKTALMAVDADNRAAQEKLKAASAALRAAVADALAEVANFQIDADASAGEPGSREALADLEESLAYAQAADRRFAVAEGRV
jgi:hypothetical protein